MTQDILEQMAFAIDLLERDARSLDMTLLAQILSMAAVELAEARKQNPLADQGRKRRGTVSAEQQPLVIGSWRWDLTCDRMTLDPEVARLIGVKPEVAAKGVPLAILIDAVHRLDKARVSEAFARATTQDEALHFIFRIKTVDGATRRLFVIGRAVFEGGRAVSLPGTLVDVTDETDDDARSTDASLTGFRSAGTGRNGANKAWVL